MDGRPTSRAQQKGHPPLNCTVCDSPASRGDVESDPDLLGQLLGEDIEGEVTLCSVCHALLGAWEVARNEMTRAQKEARVQRRLGLDKREGEVLIGKPLSPSSSLWLSNTKVMAVQGERLDQWTPCEPLPPFPLTGTCAHLLPPISLYLCPEEASMLEVSKVDGSIAFSLQSVLDLNPKFSFPSDTKYLELHSAALLGEKQEEIGNQLMCNHCSFSTSFFHLLLPHLALHSNQTENSQSQYPRLECALCGKLFKKTEVMEAHIKRDHQGNSTPWECQICGKGFTRKASLEEHVARHQGKKQRHCVTCDKYFYDTAYWRHQATVHPEVMYSPCCFPISVCCRWRNSATNAPTASEFSLKDSN